MPIELQTQSGEPSSALSARVDAQLERSVARPSQARTNGARDPQQLARLPRRRGKQDACIKVVLKPGAERRAA
jgi:hypothetical protein